MTPDPTRDLAARLSAPFPPAVIGWKPQMVKGNRALVAAYIDARDVMDRLDEVLGTDGWEDEYTPLPDGNVLCRLTLHFPGRSVVKCDVGGESDQPDAGDKAKAAVSDALKRAAVKAGVGRYLYRLPTQWVDYDPTKKQITQTPQLPPSAVPTPAGPAPARKAEPASSLPASGAELRRRLGDFDAKLAAAGRCAVGALVAHVMAVGVKAGYTADIREWTGPAIAFAVDVVKDFERAHPVKESAA